MRTLQQCAHCGFEIGDEGHSCRPEPHLTPEAARAARQVAGLELPTRAVYGLPHAGSRRERRPARPSLRPSWANDFVAFSTMLALSSLLALGLRELALMDRFKLQVPQGTADLMARMAIGLAVAAVVTMVLALVAEAARAVSRWRHRVIVLP